MNKEIIDKYINFAIENWFKIHLLNINEFYLCSKTGAWYCEYYVYFGYGACGFRYINLYELITSKEFIEATARGKEKEANDKGWCVLISTRELIEKITISQALAIRDNTLEDFINNILN